MSSLSINSILFLLSLFHQIGYIRKQRYLACALDGLCHAALVFERSACDATGQNLTLLVKELLEELGILIVDVFDTALLETAIFLLFGVHRGWGQIANF